VQGEFGETFATNAYQAGVESDYEEEDEDEPEMSETKKEIIKQMTPHVQALLNAYKKNKGGVVENLEKLDKRMLEQNQKENVFPGKHRLPMRFLLNKGAECSQYKNTAAKSVKNENDIKEIQGAEKHLEAIKVEIKNRMSEEGLPLDWTIDLPPKRRDLSLSKAEKKKNPSHGSQGTNNPRARQGPYQGPQPNNSFGSNYGTAPGPMEVDSEPIYEWQPGETTMGETILGYRPIQRRFKDMMSKQWMTTEYSNLFVIEIADKMNPIMVVGRHRVGEEAAEAYENLPENQRCVLTNCDRRYSCMDGQSITAILGYAREPLLTPSGNRPYTIFQVQYNQEKRLINRSALSKAKGTKNADAMINDFLHRIGHPQEEPKENRLAVKMLQVESEMKSLQYRQGRMTGLIPNNYLPQDSRAYNRGAGRPAQNSLQPVDSDDFVDDKTMRMMKIITETVTEAVTKELVAKFAMTQIGTTH
jgi:hypothetical protein